MPKVVFTNSFLRNWYVGEHDLMDYYERPQAFVPKKASEHSPEYDMLDYMANVEKSDGIFTADKDLLTADDVERYRNFERHSMEVGCPKYVQVVSFDNSFLEENHIMINGEIDKAKLRDAFRKSMAALIEREPKFDPSNCYWVAAIHTNTDNIHIHSSLLEFERLEDRVKKYRDGDMISLDAMNKLKSTMAQELIEVNNRTKEHTKIERELLLPALKKSFSATTAQMIALLRELPPEGGWQYNRPKMRKFQPKIDAVIDNIIASNDNLTKLFNQYKSSLDALTSYYADFYGEGTTEQSLRYTTNKLDEFYSRAGNSLLKALGQINLADYSDIPTAMLDDIEYNDDAEIIEPTEEHISLSALVNNRFGLYRYGKALITGDDYKVAKASDLGKKLLEKAADLGNKNAKRFLALEYISGENIEQDIEKGISMLSDLDNGSVLLCKIGRYLLNKYKDDPKKRQYGIDILEAQAEKDNPYALYALGGAYLSEKKYEQKGVEYLKRAADNHDHEYAQYVLGKYYLDNHRLRYAEKYLTLAAEKNNSFAYYQLGKLNNIKSRPDKAMACFKKSSELGNRSAVEYLERYEQRKARRAASPLFKKRRHSAVSRSRGSSETNAKRI